MGATIVRSATGVNVVGSHTIVAHIAWRPGGRNLRKLGALAPCYNVAAYSTKTVGHSLLTRRLPWTIYPGDRTSLGQQVERKPVATCHSVEANKQTDN